MLTAFSKVIKVFYDLSPALKWLGPEAMPSAV
jgi:hypothetical protein